MKPKLTDAIKDEMQNYLTNNCQAYGIRLGFEITHPTWFIYSIKIKISFVNQYGTVISHLPDQRLSHRNMLTVLFDSPIQSNTVKFDE